LDCLRCKIPNCQLKRRDCNNRKDEVVAIYAEPENKVAYARADELVAGGRAGTLSRAEEIVEYTKLNDIKGISLAYCYGINDYATKLADFFRKNGLKVYSCRCTINGITEKEIDPTMGENVNCNPIGQALDVNEDDSELVVEFGLCLGHDILFHKYLKKPFTVFAVKDRTNNHNPLSFFADKKEPEIDEGARFIAELGPKFAMRSKLWLQNRIATGSALVIIDLRSESAFNSGSIEGSKNVLLKDLPEKYSQLLMDKSQEIVCVCNGSIQSAYAVMFLRMKGYGNCYNLSGGYSGWIKNMDQEAEGK